MTSKEFINKAGELVKEAVEYKYDVHIVWFNKTLQNFKAMLCTISPDNFYYEVTYNGDKDEIYFDTYDKVSNQCIKIHSNKINNTTETIASIVYRTKTDKPCYFKEEKAHWHIAGFVGEWLILGSKEINRGCIKSFTDKIHCSKDYNSYRFASPMDIHF